MGAKAMRRAISGLLFVLLCGVLPGSGASAHHSPFLRRHPPSASTGGVAAGSWISDGSAYLADTSPSINYAADYTWGVWIRPNSANDNQTTYILVIQKTAGSDSYDYVYITDQFGHDLGMEVGSFTPAGLDANGQHSNAVAIGVWSYVVMRRTGAVVELFIDNVLIGTVTESPTGRAAASSMSIGIGGGLFLGEFAYPRAHSVSLSSGEMAAERLSKTAVRTSNLVLDMQTVQADGAGYDNSGNGNHMAATGGSFTWSTEHPL